MSGPSKISSSPPPSPSQEIASYVDAKKQIKAIIEKFQTLSLSSMQGMGTKLNSVIEDDFAKLEELLMEGKSFEAVQFTQSTSTKICDIAGKSLIAMKKEAMQDEIFKEQKELANREFKKAELLFKLNANQTKQYFLTSTKNIGMMLKIADQRQCPRDQITEAEIQSQIEADEQAERNFKEQESQRLTAELLKECEEKPVKKEAKQQAPRKKGKRAQPQAKPQAGAPLPSRPAPIPKIPSPSDLRHQYVMELHTRVGKKELPRVGKRWANSDPHAIRQFQDSLPTGELIQRYKEDLDDSQIQFIRACHFLPGTEKIFADPRDLKIYTFPTERGLGMVAQLEFNKKTYYGILYFGIGADGFIFHRCFDPSLPVDFSKLLQSIT